MLQERIDRVINNQQFNCQHPGNYLFVLQGFDHVLTRFTVPIPHMRPERLSHKDNCYISLEEANNIDPEVLRDIRKYGYRICLVDFNFFDGFQLSKGKGLIQEELPDWVKNKYYKISIFNTLNPLIGINPDIKSSVDRIELYDTLF